MNAMDEDALKSCLSTTARDRVGITLGASDAACGEPPFDEHHPHLRLWAWPWARWAPFERVGFEEDLRRIERWYQARGHHAAHVVRTRIVPAEAERADACDGSNGRCTVDVAVRVVEGLPTRVASVRLEGGLDALSPTLRRQLRQAVTLRRGDRFDEAVYEESKAAIIELLGEHGRATASVTGTVRVDRPRRRASITLRVTPGPWCRFGAVRVEGTDGRWSSLIRRTAAIRRGAPYRRSDVVAAQAAVYGMGAFSIALVEPIQPAGDARTGAPIDLRVRVVPLRRQHFGVGLGLQSGVIGAGQGLEQTSVPPWDVHLFAKLTRRNVLGGLGQLTLEDRPRLILPKSFPGLAAPRLGNVVRAELRQPGLLEARTWGVVSTGHEYGPDPFETFYRHRVDSGASVERFFLSGQHLYVSMGLRNSLSFVPSGEKTESGDPAPGSSVVTYWEQRIRLDLRDVPFRPHAGASMELTVHEAGYALPSSWRYLRLLPDARAYVPLPWRITLAARFALGVMIVTHADPELDVLGRELGPSDYRLRGGGASSNRGFLPGRLGDGPAGGLRRWEASVELRFPISAGLGAVLFADAGDVHRAPTFRFDHPQTSLGLGLRTFTLLGALALDIGWRVPGLQVLAPVDRRDPGAPTTDVSIGSWRFPGAVHFSLGEAF